MSIFFGRPDYHLDIEDEIVEAAVIAGSLFPTTQDEQIDYYFRQRGWVHQNGALYTYVASQQPYFKFNAFFVLMQAVGLIDYDGRTNTCRLTAFSRGLFAAAAGPEAKELETLLDEVETATEDTDLAEKVARNRALLIEKLLAEDGAFLDAANKRAAAKSGTNTTISQTTRWRRDQLIREVSKQKANYACQGCGRLTFIDKTGNNFVESHHIIEYNSTEEGPDVLQNLLVLCPNCHSKIHFARLDVIDEFYQDLRQRRVITIEQFIEIHERLTLLKLSHVQILRNKGIITQTEFDELAVLLPNP